MNDLIRSPEENPTIGLLICKDKDQTENLFFAAMEVYLCIRKNTGRAVKSSVIRFVSVAVNIDLIAWYDEKGES